jgi:hypothetical protein
VRLKKIKPRNLERLLVVKGVGWKWNEYEKNQNGKNPKKVKEPIPVVVN